LSDSSDPLAAALPTIRRRATLLDQSGAWPADDLALLADVGVMRWGVSSAFGGDGKSALDIHLGYERIASASLSVALILSQRDSAIGLLESASTAPVATELLPQLARSQIFATIGIAQLTTSRQGGPPALQATADEDGWRLNGIIPWATGAGKADWIVIGAATALTPSPSQGEGRGEGQTTVQPIGETSPSRVHTVYPHPNPLPGREREPEAAAPAPFPSQQLLIALPMTAPGVRVEPPLPLVALRSSWTGQIVLDNVGIEPRLVLRGPAEKVLGTRKNALPLGQAFLALGLCRGGLDLIAEHHSEGARSAHKRFQAQFINLRDEIIALSQPGRDADATAASPRIRGQCSDLALRIVHSAVALYKGSALLCDHPAQRLAREAMFLLVWSCPSPVIECTVDLLSEAR
jgi:alkylation response protein AidB-like acyl-CoA dehydrogenase